MPPVSVGTMNNRCGSCKYFNKFKHEFDIEYRGEHAGECINDKFVYGYKSGKVPIDGLLYWDEGVGSAGFYVGEQFGCIHHEPKE